MAILPDLQTLHTAAAAIDRTADDVEADAAAARRLLEAVPWRGPRRERVLSLVSDGAITTGRRQAAAERDLARALRELAGTVEREVQQLTALAARARRHLEDLLARARDLAVRAAKGLVEAAASGMAGVAVALATADPLGALRAAQHMVDRADDLLRTVAQRLAGLPEAHDPVWHRLGVEILHWQPL